VINLIIDVFDKLGEMWQWFSF